MNEKLTSESIKYIIARLIDNANDAVVKAGKIEITCLMRADN